MTPNRLIPSAVALALIAGLPGVAGAATPKHHRHHHAHRHHAAEPLAPSTQNAGELHRIPSMDPPSCDSPNVVTIENCRASSNGRR